MWQNLAAGVFGVPTTSLPSYTTGARVTLLRNALLALKVYRDQQIVASPSPRWANANGRPSLVFVAPEYMFVRQGFQLQAMHDLKRNRFLEKAERELVIADMQRISAEYGKQLVFVPGSIASREELPSHGAVDRDERVATAITCIKTSALAMKSVHPSFAVLTDDQLLDVRTAGDLAGRKALTPRQKIGKLEAIKKKHKGVFYIADNVAHLFNNGKAIGRYAKHGDFHERLPGASPRTIYVPGTAAGRATVGGISFGIEICLDHGLGALSSAPTATGQLPRVHLLCSAEVKVEAGNVLVRDGGYFMHASSNPNYTIIQRKRGANVEPPINPQTVQVSGFPLKMGVIELDI